MMHTPLSPPQVVLVNRHRIQLPPHLVEVLAMRREPPDGAAHSADDEETVFLRRAKILEPILQASEAYLVPIAGRGLWERYLLTKMETVIGRKPSVDLLLCDGKVSRRHCKILLSDKGPQIVDLGSTNGTFVNQARVERRYLQDGDYPAGGDGHQVPLCG